MIYCEGILQADGTVIEVDGTINHLPKRKENEYLINAKEVGGDGEFYRQKIDKFVGMKVVFVKVDKEYEGFNFKIIKGEINMIPEININITCKICGGHQFSYKIDYDDIGCFYGDCDKAELDEVLLICKECGNETNLNTILKREN